MSLNGRYRASSLPDSSKYSAKEYKDEDGYTRLTSAARNNYREDNRIRTMNMREGKTEYYDDADEIFLDNSDEEHVERIRVFGRPGNSKGLDPVASKFRQQPGPSRVTDISARLAESARIAARHTGSLASMAWPELTSLPPSENGSRTTSPRAASATWRSRNGSKTAEALPKIQPGGRLRDETWTTAPRSESPLPMTNERFQDSFSSDSRSYQSISTYSASSRKLHSPRSETHDRSVADKNIGSKAPFENKNRSISSRIKDRTGSSVAPKLVSPRSRMFPLQSLSSVQEGLSERLRDRNDVSLENASQKAPQEEKGEDPFAFDEPLSTNHSRRRSNSNKWDEFTPPPRRRFSTSDDDLGSAYGHEEEDFIEQNEARRELARGQAEHELLEYGTDRTFVDFDNNLLDERKGSPGSYFASRMDTVHLCSSSPSWPHTNGGTSSSSSPIMRLECKVDDFVSRIIKVRNASDSASTMIDIVPSAKLTQDSATLFVFPSNFTLPPGATQQVELVLYGAASPREEKIGLDVSNLTSGIKQRFRLLARTSAATGTTSLDKQVRSPHQRYAIVTADCRMIDFGQRVSALSGGSTQFRLKNQSEVESIFVNLSLRNANKAHVFHVRFRGGAQEKKIAPGCDAIVVLTLLPGPSDPPGFEYTCLVGIGAEGAQTQSKHKFSIPAKGSCFSYGKLGCI